MAEDEVTFWLAVYFDAEGLRKGETSIEKIAERFARDPEYKETIRREVRVALDNPAYPWKEAWEYANLADKLVETDAEGRDLAMVHIWDEFFADE